MRLRANRPRRSIRGDLARACVLVCLGKSVARPAHAQTPPRASVTAEDRATRRILLDRAVALSRQGDHAAALEFAQRAATIETTPSLHRFLAQEFEHAGRPVSALGEAEGCLREVARERQSPSAAELVRDCSALRTRLLTRVGVVRVVLPVDFQGNVRVGNRELSPALRGLPVPVDPGDVPIRVESSTGDVRERSVRVAAGAVLDVSWTDLVGNSGTRLRVQSVMPRAPVAQLGVASSVPLAEVWIDGSLAGIGAVARALPVGDHDVEVRFPGHRPWQRTVFVPERGLQLDATLEPMTDSERAGASRPAWVIPVAIAASVVGVGVIALGAGLGASRTTRTEITPDGVGTWLPAARESQP